MDSAIPLWPYAYGGPAGIGTIRTRPEDFIVQEQLGFIPSGNGEHVFLQIQKIGENTEFVARQLARFAGVRQRDIGYAGLKDRNAVTSQWFSVWLPGKADPDWQLLTTESMTVLQATRHNKKLKRGALAGNHFQILIRDYSGGREQLTRQLNAIKIGGMPNYFGEQRFGHSGCNVGKAIALFRGKKMGREQRGLYLSAARSFIFNHILASRVNLGNWHKALDGDVFMFASSNTWFHSAQADADINRRLVSLEIHPTGSLWGVGEQDVSAEAFSLEQSVVDQYPELAQGLLNFKVARGRRALRVKVTNLNWSISENQVRFDFILPAGSYATALLREIADSGQSMDGNPQILI